MDLLDKSLEEDVLISDIVRAMGNNTSCAALETVMNAAAANSCYRGADKVGKMDIIDAILQVVYTIRKSDGEPNPDIAQIALHEAAHVVVAEVLKPGAVSLVTLRKKGFRQGLTQYYFDTELSTEADLLNLATKSLAGRAGVELVYGRLDLGASKDIQRALSCVGNGAENSAGASLPESCLSRR